MIYFDSFVVDYNGRKAFYAGEGELPPVFETPQGIAYDTVGVMLSGLERAKQNPEIKEANEILKAHGLKLGAVQNHYSLINRSSEDSGILDYCKENDIIFFSYMVLEQGALSGKYDTKHPMPAGSARAETYNPVLEKIEVLNAELKKLADKYNVEIAQIPVAWAITKGTLPIIGVTKEKHVEDAVKAANITLTAEEVASLEKAADTLSINAIRFWEKKMK